MTAAAVLALGGCAMDPDAGDEPPPTLEERLAEPASLDVHTDSVFDVRATDADGEPLALELPAITGGRVAVRVSEDGRLLLEALELGLSEFVIDKQTGDSTIRLELADARLRLGAEAVVAARWDADGTLARGLATGDLLLDWALVDSDGDVHPLATQTIRGAEIGVQIRLEDDGSVSATLDSVVGGRIWDFGDIEVRDLTVSLTARGDLAGISR